MLPIGSVTAPQAPDLLLVLVLALTVDAVAGEMPWLFRRIPHPVEALGKAIAWCDRKLNRPHRGQADRFLRGALATLVLTGAAAGLGVAANRLFALVSWGWLAEAFLIAVLVAQKSLFQHVRAVGRALRDEGLAAGRAAVARIVGRDPRTLDEHGVARAAIESCAENLSDGIVAPVFWYVLFGLPGLLVYKTVNTLDSMIGHRNERYRAFGMTAARLDDLLNLVPARLSALLIALAALFTPGARPMRALTTTLRDGGRHPSPNAGRPEAAMAGALGLAMGGPRRYVAPEGGLESIAAPWIGDGTARAGPSDIGRALYLLCVACLLNAGWVISLWLLLARV